MYHGLLRRFGLALSPTNSPEALELSAPSLLRIQNKEETDLSRDLPHTTDLSPSLRLETVHTESNIDASSAIIVNLPQSLGSRDAKKLVRQLKMHITDETPLVILDLSHVKDIDCAGFDGLLACMQEIANHDGAIQVRAISPEAATLLEVVRLDWLLQEFAPLPTQAECLPTVMTITEATVNQESIFDCGLVHSISQINTRTRTFSQAKTA